MQVILLQDVKSLGKKGEIVKVNAKSIRVKLNHATAKFGSKIKADYETCATVTYRFAKVLSNGNAYYKSEGNVYGSIELK